MLFSKTPSFKEFNTSAFIVEKLNSWGISPITGIATTGLVVVIEGNNPSQRTVALRADMDALPINELNDVPYKSVIAEKALKNGFRIEYEAFADRNYNDDGTLVSRNEKNALIHDSEQMFDHVFRMISSQKVKTISGSEIEMLADTFCIHGDNPKAVDLIRDLSKRLQEKGIQIK